MSLRQVDQGTGLNVLGSPPLTRLNKCNFNLVQTVHFFHGVLATKLRELISSKKLWHE